MLLNLLLRPHLPSRRIETFTLAEVEAGKSGNLSPIRVRGPIHRILPMAVVYQAHHGTPEFYAYPIVSQLASATPEHLFSLRKSFKIWVRGPFFQLSRASPTAGPPPDVVDEMLLDWDSPEDVARWRVSGRVARELADPAQGNPRETRTGLALACLFCLWGTVGLRRASS